MTIAIAIETIAPDEKRVTDVAGSDLIIDIPGKLVMHLTLKDLFTWLKDNPEFIIMVLTALIGLFRSAETPPKAA